MNKQCPCCGMLTINKRHTNEVCPYCGWIDEKIGPDEYSLANGGTIRQYIVAQLGKANL